MCDSARIYNCKRCQKQVIICSHCDRGNPYCNDGCALHARQKKQREAAQRYQSSPKGRLSHALRQQRYRQRQREPKVGSTEKVTHQGSSEWAAYDSITTGQKTETIRQQKPVCAKNEGIVCHFCGCQCGDSLRWSFLHRQSSPWFPDSVFC